MEFESLLVLVEPKPLLLRECLLLRLGHQFAVHTDHIGALQFSLGVVGPVIIAPLLLALHIAGLLGLEFRILLDRDCLGDRILLGTHRQVLRKVLCPVQRVEGTQLKVLEGYIRRIDKIRVITVYSNEIAAVFAK